MPTTGPNPIDTSRILLLFFTVSLLLFVIIAFFIHRSNSPAPDLASPAPQALDDNAVGLHPSLVASFPTFTYSWVKNLHAGKCGLECAVCLSEFQDDDVLRLLTALQQQQRRSVSSFKEEGEEGRAEDGGGGVGIGRGC